MKSVSQIWMSTIAFGIYVASLLGLALLGATVLYLAVALGAAFVALAGAAPWATAIALFHQGTFFLGLAMLDFVAFLGLGTLLHSSF